MITHFFNENECQMSYKKAEAKNRFRASAIDSMSVNGINGK